MESARSLRQEDPSAKNGVFALSFNSNSAVLSEDDLKACLEGSSNSSLVVLAFQEYDYAPARPVPKVPQVFEEEEEVEGNNTNPDLTHLYRRHRGEPTASLDEARMALLSRLLGPSFELVCDVGMGEPDGLCTPPPPTLPPLDTPPPNAKEEEKQSSSLEEKQEKKKEAKPKKLEWYGFIRLIVFAKSTSQATSGGRNTHAITSADSSSSFSSLHLPGSSQGGGVVTCVVPTGSKVTGGGEVGSAAASAPPPPPPPPYAPDRSPDKGAVIAYFPSAFLASLPFRQCGGGSGGSGGLVVVCAHLNGTNKYGVGEEVFDDTRLKQLERIERAVDNLLRKSQQQQQQQPSSPTSRSSHSSPPCTGAASTAGAALLVCGDLNFRVESAFTSVEEKAKGGADFQFIEKHAASNNAQQLAELMAKHDRLTQHRARHNHCKQQQGNNNKGLFRLPLLADCECDAVAATVLAYQTKTKTTTEKEETEKQQQPFLHHHHGHLLCPTFTFGVGLPHPRPYKDKRSPSWTDRVLANSAVGPLVSCASLKHVVCSDHEPVVAVFAPPPAPPPQPTPSSSCRTEEKLGKAAVVVESEKNKKDDDDDDTEQQQQRWLSWWPVEAVVSPALAVVIAVAAVVLVGAARARR